MKNTKKNEGEIEGTIERLVDFISDSDNKELLINTLVEVGHRWQQMQTRQPQV